jgi:hypothetical protein
MADQRSRKATERMSTKKQATRKKSAKVAKKAAAKQVAAKPTLLAGGNPQIAKADGDAPVQAYIEAMPRWKHDVGRRLDALIERTVPDVRKAVRWNSPFYGVEGQGWFLSYHCFTRYVKVTFLNGASLRPLPPVESKHEDVRYLHIYEDDEFDEELVESWIRQASELRRPSLLGRVHTKQGLRASAMSAKWMKAVNMTSSLS